MEFNERKFKQLIKPHIIRGRDGDWEHCLKVVKWVRKLGEGREDLFLIVIAGYLHDFGWRDVIPSKKITLEEVRKFEKQANKNSEPFITEFLKNLGYSQGIINTIIRLVKAVDIYRSKLDDEQIIVDADNLSKLTIDHLRNKYKESEWAKICSFWEKEMPKRIKTSKGLNIYPKLLKKLKSSLKGFSCLGPTCKAENKT